MVAKALPASPYHPRPMPRPMPRATIPLLVVTILASFGTGVVWNGLAFVTREQYGFGEIENLLLAVFNGAVYVAAAFASGPLTRRLERRTSPRGVLVGMLALQAICCPLPALVDEAWLIWIVGAVLSASAAVQWPIVESLLSAGRDGRSMRQAIGWWNVAWMAAVAAAILGMAPLLALGHPSWTFLGLAILFTIAAAVASRLPSRPAEHGDTPHPHHASERYRALLSSSRVLLPLGYVLVGAISPLMPYLLADLETPLAWQTPITSVWLLARIGIVVLLWRTHVWHGRIATLVAAAALMIVGFAAMVLAGSLATMLLGLAAFGIGQGVVYYAALYYAMAVGHAGVDAGGTHEALIGAGYSVGPGVALLGSLAAGGAGIVAATWAVVAVAAVPAFRPLWTLARRERRTGPETGSKTGSETNSEISRDR